MTLLLYVLLGWALVSVALAAAVGALVTRAHLRAARRGESLTPGDDLLELQQELAARKRGTHPAF